MGADFEVLRIFGQDFFSVARHDTAYQIIEKNCRRYAEENCVIFVLLA